MYLMSCLNLIYLRPIIEEQKSKMSFVLANLKEVKNIFDELFEPCILVYTN